MKILPSLISSDLLNLQKTIESLSPISDGFHIDVMDDHFVPNLTWGPMFVNAIKQVSPIPLYVHLMVQKPDSWLDRLKLTQGDTFIFHKESCNAPSDCKKLIDAIHKKSWQAGIALNPETPIDAIQDLLPHLDDILIMSVNPGFSGQSFIEKTKEKIEKLAHIKKEKNFVFSLCVDGGVTFENILTIKNLGATHIAAAKAIFGHNDPVMAMKELRKII